MLNTTATFIGIFALIHIPFTVLVGYHRARTGIQFFDGGDDALLRKMRAHGNFTEQVPMALLAMAAAEVTGTAQWVLLLGGGSLLLGRCIHAYVVVRHGWGLGRAVGMVLTFLATAGLGACALIRTLL